MNVRIAKKILTCQSTLHQNKNAVQRARLFAFRNKELMVKKGLYIFDNGDGLSTMGKSLI